MSLYFVQSNSKHTSCKSIYKVEEKTIHLKSFKNVQFLVWHAHTGKKKYHMSSKLPFVPYTNLLLNISNTIQYTEDACMAV